MAKSTTTAKPAPSAAEVAAKTKEKRDRFIKVGGARMVKALKMISLIGNVSNKGNYSYTDADVAQMTKDLKSAVDATMARFAATAKQEAAAEYKFGG